LPELSAFCFTFTFAVLVLVLVSALLVLTTSLKHCLEGYYTTCIPLLHELKGWLQLPKCTKIHIVKFRKTSGALPQDLHSRQKLQPTPNFTKPSPCSLNLWLRVWNRRRKHPRIERGRQIKNR